MQWNTHLSNEKVVAVRENEKGDFNIFSFLCRLFHEKYCETIIDLISAMRFVRERPDVICLHGCHHISASALNAPCLSSDEDDADITLGILLLPNEISVENLIQILKSSFISEDGKIFSTKNAVNPVKAVKGVARCIPGRTYTVVNYRSRRNTLVYGACQVCIRSP
jgi:hypothetical protein